MSWVFLLNMRYVKFALVVFKNEYADEAINAIH